MRNDMSTKFSQYFYKIISVWRGRVTILQEREDYKVFLRERAILDLGF